MKYFFSALIFLHGAIHLLAFVKAFKLAHIEQLNCELSKTSGVLWMLAFLLFMLSGLAYISKTEGWYLLTFIAVILSTILIISVWSDAKFGTIANAIILIVAFVAWGTAKFHSKYEMDVKNSLEKSAPISESLLTEADIEPLPVLVKNYIRLSGAVNKPKVTNFRLEFSGKIRKDEDSDWMPFNSVQYNFIDPSSRLFYMSASMKGINIKGYHCFKNGLAFMDIRLLSWFKVQYQSGREMDISETVTFFNDMCCFAPSSLIDKRIKWLEVEGNRVMAEFSNNNITISASLFFNDAGELINFTSDDRYAAGKNNSMRRLPWATPLKNYKEFNGLNLASYGETIYSYPEGDLCYGQFNVTHIESNCKEFK